MKITSAFAEPPFGPNRSIQPLGFSPSSSYPLGSPIPPFLFDGFRADTSLDPLSRTRRGLAPFPCPIPALDELMTMPSEFDYCFDTAAVKKKCASPQPAAMKVLLIAFDHCLAAHREILDLAARWQSAATPLGCAKAEICDDLLDECDELEGIMSRLLKLGDRLVDGDAPAPKPPALPIPTFSLSRERKQATQRPTAGATLPAITNNKKRKRQ
jgi:hypothetical protein